MPPARLIPLNAWAYRTNDPFGMDGQQTAWRYPHRVQFALPPDGLRGRYGPTLHAACQIAGFAWDAWHERGGPLIVAFARSEDADRFRQWMAAQGWNDLLAG